MAELWAPKIFARKGFVRENILGNAKALDVGCGQRKLSGATGIDSLSDSRADIVHNIDYIPWPLEANTFDVILFNNVLEHVSDVVGVLTEAHRVARDGAHIVIQVPHFRSTDAFADPTHQHFFTARSLDYMVEGCGLSQYRYAPFHFEKLGFWYGWPHPAKNPLKQMLKSYIHGHQNFYDQYLSLLVPVECLTWELKVVK